MPLRRAFTLIEVLLALLLSGLVLVIIAMAIDLHLRVLDVGRTEIEQGQLARTLLAAIAADLRSAVAPSATRTSSSSTNNAAQGTTSEDAVDSTDGHYAYNLVAATEFPPQPGVYGNLNELQIDLARPPRADQLRTAMLLGPDASQQSPLATLQNVLYYLGDSSGGSAEAAPGLMRRQMDRASGEWAASQGQLNSAPGTQKPLAPEVTQIEFRFFDGTEWVEEWDSTQRKALPLAVEITMTVTRPQHSVDPFLLWGSTETAAAQTDQLRTYQLVVHLPAGKASSLQDSSTQGTSTAGAPQ